MSDNVSPVGQASGKPKNRLIASNRIEGTTVYGRDGQKVGTMHSFIVDKQSGQVAYAVLSFGGFLGMGDKLFALPWQSLKPSAKDDDKMVLEVQKDRLQAAPGFDKKNWPDMADRRWGLDIYKYYGEEPYWAPSKDKHESGSGSR